MKPPHAAHLAATLLSFVTSAGVYAGPAVNQFEVKDLDVEVGRWEFQSQNAYSWGQPERAFRELAPGNFVFDSNSVARQRYALELEVGITPRFRSRVGIEFEQQRVDEPGAPAARDDFDDLEFEELAIEGVWVFLPARLSSVGLGLLAEYQYTVDGNEADSLVLGPILETRGERWSLLLNPSVVQFFGGESDDNKLDFAYAFQLAYSASDAWLLTVEAYGTIDRLGDTGNAGIETQLFGDHDQHRLGPIAYYRRESGSTGDASELSLGFGLFFGLNDNTPDGTVKLSIEYEF